MYFASLTALSSRRPVVLVKRTSTRGTCISMPSLSSIRHALWLLFLCVISSCLIHSFPSTERNRYMSDPFIPIDRKKSLHEFRCCYILTTSLFTQQVFVEHFSSIDRLLAFSFIFVAWIDGCLTDGASYYCFGYCHLLYGDYMLHFLELCIESMMSNVRSPLILIPILIPILILIPIESFEMFLWWAWRHVILGRSS